MELSEKIRKIREDHGLTQEEMAEKLSVTRQAISKWERGLGYPSIDSLRLLSKEFGVSMNYLLDIGEEEKSKEYKSLGLKSSIFAIAYILGIVIVIGITLAFNLVSFLTDDGINMETDSGLWIIILYDVLIALFCLALFYLFFLSFFPHDKVLIEYNDFGIRVKTFKGTEEISFDEITDLAIMSYIYVTPPRLIIRTSKKNYQVFALRNINETKTILDEVKALNSSIDQRRL